ncbi:hypothetical protein E8E15_002425 [Penicillium rubens]|jgi:hypothetical protein|uniref:Pc16g00350 protein n=2 Tax=Penicillium chrysogenum species complex TaxID=254878 RepID=B6H6U6_PENRW|nr:uncharacterized protein N7525_011592 [Penicillium rubens]XP_056567859.1 uncharacterized protein N7489_003686 [Penicillium chrysogenum]CAP92705.1 Pc16g00350 [Penicillium rubens Wisconsin 54-1255]KAF3010402.1 hypothetical protein E8E15_002425 [Penicillium rubens]KAJ5037830.1 hypothetical protein NUH16_011431 [Penicillium rubens]KAJ5243590.1 hypothetical protein N7489_003686 [Penicillium chrysogenum]KAJ5257362.1 hypothetical protein N7524_008918 [Penicillium chrysogenum]
MAETDASSWKPTTLESKPFSLDSGHYTALAFVLAVCVPQAPHGTLLRYGLLLLQITCAVQAFLVQPPPVSDRAVLYTSGVLMGNLLARYFDRLYTTVPERTFHRIIDSQSPEDTVRLSAPKRLFWALELFSVTRGIGWNWRVAGIPKSPVSTTRFQFAAAQLLRWTAMYAGLHLVNVTCQVVSSNPNASPSLPGNLHIYALIVCGFAITIYSHFAILMLPLSALCVGLQVGPRSWQDIASWPPNFGSVREAYSIRRFWGYTWHQQLRRQAGAPGAYLISLLPDSVTTSKQTSVRLARRYSLLMMSFVISGLIHACGTYQVTRALGLPLSDGGEMKYFTLQGMAIIAEDFGCWVLGIDDRGTQPGVMRRWMGYAITLSWYVWSRVQLKGVPVALAMGIEDERGDLFAALELVRLSAAAVPGNFVATAWELIW